MRLLTTLFFAFSILFACNEDKTVAPDGAGDASGQVEPVGNQAPGGNAANEGASNIDLSNRQVIAGEIKDFGDRDLKSEGRVQGEVEARAETLGFAEISPCEVIKVSDLEEWPGGLGNVSSQRNNVGEIVLGCVYTFEATTSSKPGKISVYFSDNQTAQQATESVQYFAAQPGGQAVVDWDVPASFNAETGEFVWSRGRNFVTLLVQHPAVRQKQLEWSRSIATNINARL